MIGISEIKRVIPHRHPILLVDRVLTVEPGVTLTAIKAVTCNEPCYQAVDHEAGPEAYAYPASLLIESWAQTAVLLAVWEQPNPDVLAGMVELAGSISDVRFGAPVHPGDVLEHRVRLVKAIGDTSIVEGETRIGSTDVMKVGQFVLALRSIDVLRPQPTTV